MIDKIDLEEVLANIPGQIYVKDRNGVYLFSNDRPEKVDSLANGHELGAQIVGKTDRDFPWKEQAETFRKNDKEVMETGETIEFVEAGRLNDNTIGIFIAIKAPFYNKEGEMIGIIGNSINITEYVKGS